MSNRNSSRPTNKALTPSHQSVLDILQKRTGLIFPEARLVEVTAAMDQAAQSAKLTLGDYANRLACDDAMFDDLCNKVTIDETYFFRDPRQFEFVKRQVIPAWRSTRTNIQSDDNAGAIPFQVWSAGCSNGEEAYSLAILFDQEGLGNSVKLTATDICQKALAHAARAKYSPWSLRTSDQKFCHSYFEHKDNLYSLKEKYCSSVRFAHLNLVDDILAFNTLGLADLDLIFCRNVLIYFDSQAVAQVVKTFHSLLKPGGFLVLGPSDPSANQFASFEVVVSEWGLFYKKSSGDPSPQKIHTTHPQVIKSDESDVDMALQTLSHRKHQALRNSLPVAAKKNISGQELLSQAQTAYNHGRYEKAFTLTGSILDDPPAAILHIRALANFRGSAPAEKVLKELLKQHISSFHLQYLHGHLLLDLGQLQAALAALKRSLFLDSKATMAHFSLALVQKSLGDKVGAMRSFRNVIELCKNQPPDQILPYGDGERVKILTIQAQAELYALSES